MTNQELERLKNTDLDFSKVVKAATEVDPTRVKAREESGLGSLVGKLGMAVYVTTIRRFGPKEHDDLKNAITSVRSAINADTPLRGKVEHVIMLAEILLADLNAVPSRKAKGATALTTDCEQLARMLPG